MSTGNIWTINDPQLREQLRLANEERAAIFYAAFRAVTRAIASPIGRLVEAARRANRARATYSELSHLSDHLLRDIGIWPSEIHSIAQAVATTPPGSELTLADLRQVRSATSPVSSNPATPPRDVVVRHGRPADRTAKTPARANSVETGRAA